MSDPPAFFLEIDIIYMYSMAVILDWFYDDYMNKGIKAQHSLRQALGQSCRLPVLAAKPPQRISKQERQHSRLASPNTIQSRLRLDDCTKIRCARRLQGAFLPRKVVQACSNGIIEV